MTPSRLAKFQATLAQRQPDLTIITDQVNKGQNIAALLRTCDAVGIHEAHAVLPLGSYRDYGGTARGSQQWVNVQQYEQIDDALLVARQQGMQLVAAHFSDRAVDFKNVDYTRPTALILGAEMEGVSPAATKAADYHVTIPMLGMTHSFNVSVAGAVILLEAQRQRQFEGMYGRALLTGQAYEDTLFRWCHPAIADYCQHYELAYPRLDEQGEVPNLSQWYADARRNIANR
ncbi:MAG: tRNA (guanosine(18)-2'-O)-methyltransferase TrmH [Gammaproteobacteria bacterium]|nr:tRNA (guanosine(18)-2'-O)-methyltransferase TrmH [Gammaproteobacteria bacterium]MCP4881980.1 tRNA (guanosine(18)-2'-O)-methyltransferase TrmH [Gammaproteobacteria bacterium]